MHRKKGEQNTMFFRYWKIIKKWKINFKQKGKKRNLHARLYFVVTHFPLFVFFFFCLLSTPKRKNTEKLHVLSFS